ncbi:MAG: hypothetical protein ABIT82_01820 [Ramlibacter sp.]
MNHRLFAFIKWLFLAIGIIFLVRALFAGPDTMFEHATVGVVLTAIGGGIYAQAWWSAKNEAHLRQYGHLIQAEFLSVEIDKSLKVAGKSPYCIVAQWNDASENKLHVFRSANIWFDPSSYVDATSIPVYLDPMKPSHYFMDLSFLLKARG